MASFPNSVYSPATKSNGQTVQASFFNDPDAEIAAMQDGYLNGSARLNSSHSTVVALSVTGGSTFASHVTLGSTATLQQAGRALIRTSSHTTPIFGADAQGSTVASGASLNIGNFSGVMFVTSDLGDAPGLIMVRGNGQMVTEISDPSNRYSTAAGTTGMTNVIFSGSTAVLLENRTGAERAYSWVVLGITL